MSGRIFCLVIVASLVASAAGGQVAGPAERLLAEARHKAEVGDVDGALVDWQAVVSQFGDTEAAIEARLAVGRASIERADWEQAAASAQEVIDAAPRSAAASSAYVILGEAKLGGDTEDAEAAAETFALAWDLFAGRGHEVPGRTAGRVREGEVHLRLGQVAEAEKAFLDVIESQRVDAWVSRAYRGLARARAARGDWVAAVEALQEGMTRALRLAEDDLTVGGDVAGMRRLAAAAHRLHLRDDNALPWSRSSLVSGVEFKRPVAVAASDDGRLVVVDHGLDEVLLLTDEDRVERKPWRRAGRPFWTDDERWWVPVEAALQTVDEGAHPVAGQTEYKSVAAGAPSGFGATLLMARPDAVVRVSESLAVLQTIPLSAGAKVTDLDADALGRVVMVDRRAGTLLRAESDRIDELTSGLDKPSAVAVGPFGYIYVLEDGQRITVLDPDGRRVLTAGPELPGGQVLKGAEDLTVDGSGRLWVAEPHSDAVILLE